MSADLHDTARAAPTPAAELAALRDRVVELEARAIEAEETLAAIRNGDVDALIVGDDIYTLDSANAASNEMRRDVLAQMRDAVLAFDADDHLIFMNAAAEQQYGRTASEMLGRPRDELYRERWPDALAALQARRQLRESGSYRAESVHRRLDGQEIHVEAAISTLHGAGHQPRGTLCVIRDIGDRVQHQATLAAAMTALAQRERQFATLVQNSPDVFARFDPQGRYLYVSPVVTRYTGLEPQACLGRSPRELGLAAPAADAWEQAMAEVFATGRIGRIKYRLQAPDGVARIFESRLVPERADDGRIESVLSIASNITEQEQVDVALRESKARLEFTLAAAHVGEWEIDIGSGACRHSALYDRCFGYAESPPGWNIDALFDHVHPAERAQLRALAERRFAAREDLDFECRVIWPDGTVHWIDVHGSPYLEAAGEPGAPARLRYLGIIADVTARKTTEEVLRDADVRKDEFLATLAHELRNPLAPIRNAVQIMQLSRDEAMHANARAIIERQLRQMVHLVDDLLDVSRISQGKVELRREPVDVAQAMRAALETSRPLIDAGRHALDASLPPDGELWVMADATRLTQIIANILNNAAKYTPDGGRIRLAVVRAEGEVVISVSDTGIGIAPDMLPRVFDMFAQLDRSTERAQGGLGIGLALVKRLVELHGGSVEAMSDGAGLGSRFVVRLPLIARAEAPPGTPGGGALAGSIPLAPARRRVLVVDDNVDSAQSLAQVLAMVGFEIALAHDGVEAVAQTRAWDPDIVLLDIGMPRMTGHEAARAIRAMPGGARPLLVALSGWGQEKDRDASRRAGFEQHFVKPVDIESLLAFLAGVPPR